MAAAAVPDFFDIPLIALRVSTKEILSKRLNPPKIISTDDGTPRDWRRLAELASIPSEDMSLVASRPDQTSHILEHWARLSGSIGELVAGLEGMDRFDVIDDTAQMMAQDAIQYVADRERAATSASAIDTGAESRIITYGDRIRVQNGLEPQHYDAFLLFADADQDFATQSIENLEGIHNLKLCLKDRDLLGGLRLEHGAIMRLISERCNHLIVVFSPSFLESEDNMYLATFAQALGIDQQQRKVVPVLYRKCELPADLKYIYRLDYTRFEPAEFWTRLKRSIETPAIRHGSPASTNVWKDKDVDEDLKKTAEKSSSMFSKNVVSLPDITVEPVNPESPSNSEILLEASGKNNVEKKSSSKALVTRFLGVLSKKKSKKQKPKKQIAEMAQ